MNTLRLLLWFAGLLTITTVVAVAAPTIAAQPDEVVFIDRAVPDAESLIAALRPETDLRWIDAGEQGWSEMESYFRAHRGLRAVYVISHGEPGALLIAGARLDVAAFAAHRSTLDAWRASLGPDAFVALYGCNIGQGKAGRSFVTALSERLGGEVSASDNPTGRADQGGDWRLEVCTGTTPPGLPFMGHAAPHYRGLLLPTVGTQTINNSTFTTDGNSPRTFSNTYFTISGVDNGTNSSISIYDSGPPGAGGLAPGTVDNSGPPYGTRVYKLVVTAKSAAMGSFKLSAINLQSYQADYFRNITIRATPSDGSADIISTPYSTGTTTASAGPYPVVLGTGITNTQITKFAVEFSLYKSPEEVTNSTTTDNMTLVTFDIASPLPPLDSDGTVTAGTGIIEPVALPTTATTAGGAVSLFDFKITDGGTADTVPLTVSQIVVNTSGTADFTKVTWLLNGPDATDVVGTYSSGTNTITFSGLGISVANASNETYTVKGYYNNNAGLTENQTYILSVNGSSGFTIGTGRTKMATGQSAVTNGTGAKVSVTATKLLFTTQPSGSTSGSALTGQPIVKATDAVGNVDVDFVANVTLAVGSGAGSLSGTLTKAGVSGVATFTDVAYTATADQQAFMLTTSNVSSLTNATSNSVTSDVVATVLQFSTQPVPTSIPSGIATGFSTVPVVRAVNAGGIVDTAARNVTLTVTNTSGGAAAGTVNALGGVSGDTDASATIVTIPTSSGVATFTGLSVTYTNDASATNSIALHAVSSGLTAANSTTITSTISPAITSALTASGTYGTAISTYTITGSNSPTSYSASGLPSGLSVNTSNGQITGTPTTNGSFNVTIGATNAGGTGTATLVFTVAKAALSITGVTVSNKTYDGTTAATLNVGSAAFSGVVNSDTLTLGSGSATGTFTNKDVGTGKAVTVSGFTVSGTNSGNYTLGQPTGLTANITTKTLIVSGLSASAKTYDGTTTATLSGTAALQSAEAGGTGTTSDGKPYTGDTVSLSGTASGAFASKDAATGVAVTVTGLTLTGAQASNYSVTAAGLTANITTKALTVSGLSVAAKTYDGLTTASLSGMAALQVTEAAGAGTTSDGKPYSVDSVSLSGTAAGTFADKNIGTAKAVTVTGLSLTGAGNTNYTVTQPTGLTANITAATLTVTADAKSRAYGLANPTFTATITGYVNGETSAVLSGSASLTTSATAASVPGAYTITAAMGTLSATNYTFSFVNGTLTVSAQVIDDWRAENFTPSELLDANISGPNADPDSDGVTNLYEYAFGTDPNDPLSGPGALQYSGTLAGGGTLVATGQPVSRVETSGSGTITRLLFVQRDATLTSDLSYTPQFSSNGTTWVDGTGSSSVLAADGLYEVISVPYTLFVGGKKTRYYRILVEIIP